MAGFDAFNPNIQFTYESSKKSVVFSDHYVSLYTGRLESTVHVKPTIKIICIIHRHIQNIRSDLLYFAKLYVSVKYVLVKTTFEIIASK